MSYLTNSPRQYNELGVLLPCVSLELGTTTHPIAAAAAGTNVDDEHAVTDV
jgi:hypothetical protein